LIAAGRAAESGAMVWLLEKNSQPGKKLLIAGAGRCNVTSSADLKTFVDQFFGQGRFLYPAFSHFFRPELLELLANYGTPCYLDHQGKYFPVSNQAKDVLDALQRYASAQGVRLLTGTTVLEVHRHEADFHLVTDQGNLGAAAVILTTGGFTYPSTGSTGDGYRIAQALGHSIVKPRPALAPLVVAESYVHQLAGLSVADVEVSLLQTGHKTVRRRGDLLLTHKGVSGPVILQLSRDLATAGQLEINLLPSLSRPELTSQILSVFALHNRQQIKNCLDLLIPHRLVEPLLIAAGLPPERMAGQMNQDFAGRVADSLQRWRLTVTGNQGVHLAMVTAGGIALREVNPSTLASKLVPGLYFAGEVLDLDGDTGGYNLQAAFSTGYLAGESAADYWKC
jgi:predicted Rossmann fold flavoprotein